MNRNGTDMRAKNIRTHGRNDVVNFLVLYFFFFEKFVFVILQVKMFGIQKGHFLTQNLLLYACDCLGQTGGIVSINISHSINITQTPQGSLEVQEFGLESTRM